MTKKAVLDMRAFYKAVIIDLQKKLLVRILLRALKGLNPLEPKVAHSLQHCSIVASHMPSIQPGEEMKAGDEWIRYQKMNMTEDAQSLHMDHFWKKVYTKKDNCGDQFEVFPKMVKCALALCHSNAGVERSLSVNKRMLTKQNVSVKDETIIGLRATNAAVQDYVGVQNTKLLWT